MVQRIVNPIKSWLQRRLLPPPEPTLGREFAEQGPVPNSTSRIAPNELEQFFDSRVEGHGIWKWRHYFEIYEQFLRPYVGRPVRVLEIGVYSGGSLDMWQSYFGPSAHITGVDIQPSCRMYARKGVEIIIGDQGSEQFWENVCATTEPFDVVIDDGSHVPAHQGITLKGIFKHIRPGGVYICEDIQGPSWFGDVFGTFSSLLHEVGEIKQNGANLEERLSFVPSEVQRRVHSVHVFPMVAVIQKRADSVERFVAPMHGTKWQPSSQFSQTNTIAVPTFSESK